MHREGEQADEGLLDRILPLSLSKLWLLVTFGKNLGPGDTGDRSLKFNVATCTLLDLLLSGAFLMLSSVVDGPGDTARIATHIGRALAFGVQIDVNLIRGSIGSFAYGVGEQTLPSVLTERMPCPG